MASKWAAEQTGQASGSGGAGYGADHSMEENPPSFRRVHHPEPKASPWRGNYEYNLERELDARASVRADYRGGTREQAERAASSAEWDAYELHAQQSGSRESLYWGLVGLTARRPQQSGLYRLTRLYRLELF